MSMEFELHHEVISAWAELRRECSEPPCVLSLDYHTDIMPCFRGKCPPPEPDAWKSPACAAEAVRNLRHDEHFDWALRAGVIGHAAIISLSPPATAPAHPELEVRYDRALPAPEVILNRPEEFRARAELVLDREFLEPLLDDGYPYMERGSYILDIDCDFLLCEAALTPPHPEFLLRLAERAALITLSRENDWVRLLKLPGERMTGTTLAARLSRMFAERI